MPERVGVLDRTGFFGHPIRLRSQFQIPPARESPDNGGFSRRRSFTHRRPRAERPPDRRFASPWIPYFPLEKAA